jgi:SNF2 family DNA or RNA helicase
MFGVLKTPRRIILSGTPIQNDLGEFHAMVNNEASGDPLFDIDLDH